jgi:hypothetical protein
MPWRWLETEAVSMNEKNQNHRSAAKDFLKLFAMAAGAIAVGVMVMKALEAFF